MMSISLVKTWGTRSWAIVSMVITLMAITLMAVVPRVACSQSIIVVVNSANPVTSLSKDQLASIYLKQVKKWNNNASIVPVDQARHTKIRETFSRAVLDRSEAMMETYWQAQVFSGKDIPPSIRATDADVLAYVRANPNAIGYVTPDTPLGADVKAITVSGL